MTNDSLTLGEEVALIRQEMFDAARWNRGELFNTEEEWVIDRLCHEVNAHRQRRNKMPTPLQTTHEGSNIVWQEALEYANKHIGLLDCNTTEDGMIFFLCSEVSILREEVSYLRRLKENNDAHGS